MGRHTTKKEIFWYEPKWSHIPKFKMEMKELKSSLFKRLGRVFAFSALIFLVLYLVVDHYYPDLEFNWIKTFALGWLCVGAMIVCFILMLYLFKPCITVGPRGIRVVHGSSVGFLRMEDVRAARIDRVSPGRYMLVVEWKDKKKAWGLSKKVDHALLKEILADKFSEGVVAEG